MFAANPCGGQEREHDDQIDEQWNDFQYTVPEQRFIVELRTEWIVVALPEDQWPSARHVVSGVASCYLEGCFFAVQSYVRPP